MKQALAAFLISIAACSGNTNKPRVGSNQDIGADMSESPSDVGADDGASGSDVGTVDDIGTPPDLGVDGGTTDSGISPPDTGLSGVDCGPHMFQHEGVQRGYILCAPSPLPAGPVPVVLGFHGGGGNAGNWYGGVAMHELAGDGGFAMVYMQGCRDGATDCATAGGSFLWSVQKPGEPSTIDDESYTLEVINRLGTVHGLDVGPLFAMGHSLGGMFLYTLRCDYPDLFAAVAPISGTTVDGTCTATGDTSIYHVHGTEDPNIPFDTGCCSAAQQNSASPQYIAACDSIPRCFNPTNWWPRVRDGLHPVADLVGLEEVATDALGCSTTRTQTPDHAECQALDGCRAGTGVEVCLVPGASHSLNTIEPSFDYRTYIWSRFQRHL